MAMTTVLQPVTANVISGVGVPKLWSTVISSAEAVASVELDTLLQSYLVNKQDQVWGLFDSNNNPVLTAGRVRAIDMRSQYRKTDAPQENGAFMSYNKVRLPSQIMIEMLCDGSAMSYGNTLGVDNLLSAFGVSGAKTEMTHRKEFMSKLDTLVADLNLYYVTTPEISYANMNVLGYAIRRSVERGVTLLFAEIMMEEVRVTHKHSTINTAGKTGKPSGASSVNTGNVQTQTNSSATTAAIGAGGFY